MEVAMEVAMVMPMAMPWPTQTTLPPVTSWTVLLFLVLCACPGLVTPLQIFKYCAADSCSVHHNAARAQRNPNKPATKNTTIILLLFNVFSAYHKAANVYKPTTIAAVLRLALWLAVQSQILL
jgi:hypothetical protein